MKLAKAKIAPQILFEKDLPQLSAQPKVKPYFDSAVTTIMFLAATILTFTSWFILERIFGEDFME